ncbi:paramyosin, short form-like isoform X1 [Thrips palmi]|uniref:Paramyosin, short form-like isoform X1 n=1 Tax=Thrips palmi TaxID=161013 RepID=A0A6P8Y718_THRPL|nr:paramyosin, short form-like isoform X1 [Thrips palmi]
MPRQRELSMPIPRWQKPATKYYDNNYSFGMNFYQPMIDWLDDRDRGLRPRPPPHLPWLNERGLKQYDPSQQGIKTYSKERARQLAVDAQLRAQESLRESKEVGPLSHPRSPFSLAKQVEVATSLTKKVLGESHEERHADKIFREKELADLRRRTEDALLEFVPSKVMATTDLESSSYRAKSRRAIANELIMESMRHLQDSRTDEQIRRAYSDTRRGVRTYQTPYWYFPWSWEDKSIAPTSKYLAWERPRYDYTMSPWACEYPLSYRYLGNHQHSYDSCRPIRSYTIRYCPCFSRTVV